MAEQNTPPPRADLARRVRQHLLSEVCAHYGVSYWGLRQWMGQYGLTKRVPPPPAAELLLFLKKHTIREAVAHFGVGMVTIRRVIREANPKADKAVTLAEAARQLRLSRTMLSLWYRNGHLPEAIKLGRTRIVIPPAAVRRLRKAHSQGETKHWYKA